MRNEMPNNGVWITTKSMVVRPLCGIIWLLLAAILITLLLWLFCRRNTALNAFQGLKPGMTYDEVEARIGLKPGDYCTYEYVEQPLGVLVQAESNSWVFDDGQIIVTFNSEGTATDVSLLELYIVGGRNPIRGSVVNKLSRSKLWSQFFPK